MQTGQSVQGQLSLNWVFEEIMDRMGVNVYVTDIETDEILFMNKGMKEAFGLSNPEGKICWQVLQQGQGQRCAFCPVALLNQSDPENASCTWEETNSLTGHIYQNYDSLMRWGDGRLVHFQHKVDITENRHLHQAATIDELTGVLNRRHGKSVLEQSLRDRCFVGIPVTVCMLDINDLRQLNNTYGHQMGDLLLVSVTSAVRQEMGPEDYMMRLAGDKFLTVFMDADSRQVGVKMRRVLDQLRAQRQFPEMFPYDEFCYGVVELEGEDYSVDHLLEEADEKLYEQKRQLHIRKAEDRRRQYQEQGRLQSAQAGAFEYDQSLLYDALVQSTDDYLFVCNMKTGLFRYPQRMVEEFELPGQVVENAAAVWGARVHESDKTLFLESNQEIADGRVDSHSVEYRAKNRQGEWVWVRCRGRVERDANGEPALFAGMITNLGKKDNVDHITGLPNRYEFEQEVRSLLEHPSRSRIAVMNFDIDNLKRINSLYDRSFGDEVLRLMGQRIQSALPPNAAVFRLDADEFGVILRGGEREVAVELFNRVKKSFSHQQEYDGKKFYCTVSCGCAVAPADGKEYQELMKHTAYALEHAKQNGKNQLSFFSEQAVNSIERDLELTELLRDSVENGFAGFQLYYQPLFDKEKAVYGAEALARWRCEKFGVISPAEFVPLLEESGLILPVGRWVLEQAIQQCRSFLEYRSSFAMGVNLSYLQLEELDLPQYILEMLRRYRVEPSHLTLELTESCLADDPQRITRLLEILRGSGLHIAMDDFGTGYSSLSVLKNTGLDAVKIDRAFVNEIENSAFNRSFIRLVVELCHVGGMNVCVEGIETEEQLNISSSMGADLFQGYLYGRPVPAEEFCERYLRQEDPQPEAVQ